MRTSSKKLAYIKGKETVIAGYRARLADFFLAKIDGFV
jgi:hypothetical protein